MSIKDDPKRASSETTPSDESLKRSSANSPIVPAKASYDPRVQIVIEFMSANLSKKLSAVDFGRAVRLSSAQVSRLFKNEFGFSPSEYLIRLRMERAEQLMSNRLLSVKEIMATTGYGNRGHFLQHFKRYFGLPPSDYRRRLASKPGPDKRSSSVE